MATDRKTELDVHDIEAPPNIAEPEPEPEPEPKPEQKTKKSFKITIKLIVIGFVVLIILMVVAGVAFKKLYPPQIVKKDVLKEPSVDEDSKEQVNYKTYSVGNFFFALNAGSEKGEVFFKLSISAKYDNGAVFKEFNENKRKFNLIIYTFLKKKDFTELQGKDKKEKLNVEILNIINSELTMGKMETILFTEYFLM